MGKRIPEDGALQMGTRGAGLDLLVGARQLAANDLAHTLLQIGKSVEAEAIAEAHDR